MTIFIDSGVFVALLNKRDKKHPQANKLLRKLKDNSFGMRVTTDYVLDEVITTLWARTHRKDIIIKAYRMIRQTPPFVHFKFFSQEWLDLAWEKWQDFAKWPEKPLSFTDCTILAFMEREKVSFLASFDSEFDGLVTILD